jgi:transcriptional regulator with XRE-family HTH domain
VVMIERLRIVRRARGVSPEEVERRAGLPSSYFDELESGRIVPSLETWERIARALDIPLVQLFYDGERPPELPNLPGRKTAEDIAGASNFRPLRKAARNYS